MRRLLPVLLISCAVGRWETVPAEKPATRAELAAYPVSVADPALRETMKRAGFVAVERPPYKGELELTLAGGLGTLCSDGFFIDEVRGTPAEIARALAVSDRVAWVVRNSGTVEQREIDSW